MQTVQDASIRSQTPVIPLVPNRVTLGRVFNDALTASTSYTLAADTILVEIKASADGVEVIGKWATDETAPTTSNCDFSVLPGETRHFVVVSGKTKLNLASVDGTSNAIVRLFYY